MAKQAQPKSQKKVNYVLVDNRAFIKGVGVVEKFLNGKVQLLTESQVEALKKTVPQVNWNKTFTAIEVKEEDPIAEDDVTPEDLSALQ